MNRDFFFPWEKSNLSFLLEYMYVSCSDISLEVLNIEYKIGKCLHFEHFKIAQFPKAVYESEFVAMCHFLSLSSKVKKQ